ncbi:hypothetical protein VNO78_30772 [Psophocarpus tetragonolobus]|uniref:Transmembrane protein n=1 Tax=Psophocarpus tetragonolobus TaxID=3891 RepID=A0AAN9X652_PSOTE
MDREQEEKQYLVSFDTNQEEPMITISWKRIFTQTILTLILPLSFIFLTYIKLSHLLFKMIPYNGKEFQETNPNPNPNTPQYHMISSELITISLIQISYFTLLIVFSLLSTSSLVYTIASILTPIDVTFKGIMSFVTIEWKTLVLAFLSALAFFALYNLGTMMVICLWGNSFGAKSNGEGSVFVLIAVFYFIGFSYFTVVGQVALLVHDLEDSYWEIEGMEKSEELVKGKMVLSIFTLFTQVISLVSIWILWKEKVVGNEWRSESYMERRENFGLSFYLVFCLFLFGFVLQAVIYFVCRSYHYENINMLGLEDDHLEAYGVEYVQLEDFEQV